jgi:hypothetical protein
MIFLRNKGEKERLLLYVCSCNIRGENHFQVLLITKFPVEKSGRFISSVYTFENAPDWYPRSATISYLYGNGNTQTGRKAKHLNRIKTWKRRQGCNGNWASLQVQQRKLVQSCNTQIITTKLIMKAKQDEMTRKRDKIKNITHCLEESTV